EALQGSPGGRGGFQAKGRLGDPGERLFPCNYEDAVADRRQLLGLQLLRRGWIARCLYWLKPIGPIAVAPEKADEAHARCGMSRATEGLLHQPLGETARNGALSKGLPPPCRAWAS